MRPTFLRFVLASVGVVLAAATLANDAAPAIAPPARDWIPPLLRPWIGWALHDAPDAACPRLAGNGARTCVFASTLALAIEEGGATFDIAASAHRPDAVLQLPGHSGAWPQDVRVDGKQMPVVSEQSDDRAVPQVALAPGAHRIQGRISWRRMPAQLRIPPGYAAVSVQLRGVGVLPDDAGIVWLTPAGAQAPQSDALSVRVFREVVDEAPATVETAIELTIAGKPREISVPGALLPGFTALQLRGGLPVQLDGANVRVAAVAGKYWVYVTGRNEEPVSVLTLPAGSAAEVWSFAGVDELRRADVQGPLPVDPRQAEVPSQWQQLPAWRVQAGESLRITQRHRGDAGQAPSHLTLARTLWLDDDGAGLTFHDRLSGTLAGAQDTAKPAGSWRLDMGAPFDLGRVSVNGQDQYLTRADSAASAATGIEVRVQDFNLEADGRIQGHAAALPVTGWNTDVQQAGATLNVPPGWRLVHASGVERADGSWSARWTLWDLFLALLVCFAAARVFGVVTALVLAAALALCWTLPHSPGGIWLLPVITTALAQVAGKVSADGSRVSRWAKVATRAALAVVGLSILAFSVQQIRAALHPVLEVEASFGDGNGLLDRMEPMRDKGSDAMPQAPAPALAATPAPTAARTREAERSALGLESASAAKRAVDSLQILHRGIAEASAMPGERLDVVDPSAKVQTGPGVPNWHWRAYHLHWSGPVKADQHMRLWMAPPWLVRIGNILTVILLLTALWRMAGQPRPGIAPAAPNRPQGAGAPGAAGTSALALALAAIVCGAGLLGASGPARAQEAATANQDATPAGADGLQNLLRDLRTRLLELPPCAGSCVGIERLVIMARPELVQLQVVVHARAEAVVPLPGGPAWRGAHNELDGGAGEFTDQGDGQVAVRVDAGVHTVVRTLPAAALNEIAIGLARAPGLVQTHLEGWQLSGLADDGTAGASLDLVRVQRPHGPAAVAGAGVDAGVPPFSRVGRTFALGLHWQAVTLVDRIDSGNRPQEVRVALLPDEAVTTPGIRVAGGYAIVNVLAGSQTSFTSTLSTRSPLVLTAGKAPGQFEVWSIEASGMWDLALSGTPPVSLVRDGAWSPRWRPWPGETVTVRVERPQGASGATLTIDQVQVVATPGARATDTHASIALRASLGGTHRFELPEGARLLSLKRDGQDLPAYVEARAVPVLIEPGSHKLEISWREDRGVGNVFRVPRLGLGAAAVNASVQTSVPADRWLLLATGPTMGPVVLFWSMLLVVVLVALAAARLADAPLSTGAWLALAIGAGQAGLAPALTVLAFIVAVNARARWAPALTGWKFNVVQVLFALFAAVAIATLFEAVHNGLLGRPSMLVQGNASSDQLLRWYQDRVAASTPEATIFSLPLWVWRTGMLVWSVWLALTVVRVAGWTWHAFTAGGKWQQMGRHLPETPPAPPPA